MAASRGSATVESSKSDEGMAPEFRRTRTMASRLSDEDGASLLTKAMGV